MKCLEVWVNGQRLFAAGLPPPAELHGHIFSWERRPEDALSPSEPRDWVSLHFSGTDPSTGDHVSWPIQGLRIGDEVLIRVVEQPSPDEPTSRVPHSREEREQRRRAMYERLKQQFDPPATSRPERS
jgi:hypothetical protein